jgi:hypothetical protein
MSEAMTSVCPHCGQVYSMLPRQAGQTVACTNCQKQFVAAPQATQGLASLGARRPDPHSLPKRTNGIAILSFVLGLAICFPPASILAIVLGIAGIVKAKNPRVGGRGLAIAGLILGVVGPMVMLPVDLAVLLPALNRARETANRVQCAAHLENIGQAALQHARIYNHGYPPDLGSLVDLNELRPEEILCPSTKTSLPLEWDTFDSRARSAWVDANSDYLYYGAGQVEPLDPAIVIAMEKEADQGADGVNVLYADGKVKFVPLKEAKHIEEELAKGVNPPGSEKSGD